MASHKKCSKCDGLMEEGFMLDVGPAGKVMAAKWQEGLPEASFWTGVKYDAEKQVRVCTYRCLNCGFLESYAQ